MGIAEYVRLPCLLPIASGASYLRCRCRSASSTLISLILCTTNTCCLHASCLLPAACFHNARRGYACVHSSVSVCPRACTIAGVRAQLKGHTDTVTGLRLSPDGNLLLSNAMDNQLRIWDTRAFVEGEVSGATSHDALHTIHNTLRHLASFTPLSWCAGVGKRAWNIA